MVNRKKHSSPTLNLEITDDQRAEAIASNSGGCLIADAIKKQYPHLTGVAVDMATIRVTDREAGLRYTYLTNPGAQHILLAFDQGWPNPTEHLTIRRAVQITKVIRSKPATEAARRHRTELAARRDAGESLTPQEKAALTRHTQSAQRERPTANGPAELHVTNGGSSHGAVVVGGRPRVQGPAHPNLLRGRNRHFGAKLADPGQAFTEAVEAAVRDRLRAPEPTP